MRKLWAKLRVPPTWWLIVPYHVMTLYGIIMLILGVTNPWWIVASIIGSYIMFDVVTEGFLHRTISHNAQVPRHRIIWYIYMLLGIVAGQGSALFWGGHHRSIHHPYSDQPKDYHSPVAHSWWTAYMGWMIDLKADREILRLAKPLLREPFIRHTHRYYGIWLLSLWSALLIIPALIFGWSTGINFFVYGVMIPCVYALHCFSLINVFGHVPSVKIFGRTIKLGYRNFATRDKSVNVPWLWPLLRGVAWHNNHHGKQASAHFGGEQPWEFDPLYHVSGLTNKKRNRVIRAELRRKTA